MPDIVLATLNAKYIHAAFGLRYLMANLGDLQPRACIVEFDINQRPLDIAEVLLAREPRIIGLGVYIWNVDETREVVAAIKRVS
ncbi:MAG TPA: B12-binding domain-containing radical SAM protein, partial [Methylomirabilota bacterium]|nr:B12-binding domain-containing radical SAM protein [Methylomirabilota bacterium]